MFNGAMNQCNRSTEFMSDVRKESNLLFRNLFYVLSHGFQLFVLDSQFLRTQFHFLFQSRFLFTITPHLPLIE